MGGFHGVNKKPRTAAETTCVTQSGGFLLPASRFYEHNKCSFAVFMQLIKACKNDEAVYTKKIS